MPRPKTPLYLRKVTTGPNKDQYALYITGPRHLPTDPAKWTIESTNELGATYRIEAIKRLPPRRHVFFLTISDTGNLGTVTIGPQDGGESNYLVDDIEVTVEGSSQQIEMPVEFLGP